MRAAKLGRSVGRPCRDADKRQPSHLEDAIDKLVALLAISSW